MPRRMRHERSRTLTTRQVLFVSLGPGPPSHEIRRSFHGGMTFEEAQAKYDADREAWQQWRAEYGPVTVDDVRAGRVPDPPGFELDAA
jgi:hypothetical protein